MKITNRSFVAMLMVSSLLFLSCEKENIEEVLPESNSMVVGQFTVSSFTANLTGTFDGVSKTDLVMGKRGVLYGVKSEKTENAFKDWLNGNDNPDCIIVDKADFSGSSMKCAVNGLTANTEYSFCLFLQRKDGSREISQISSLKTQPFAPEMKNLDVKGVECFVAFADGKVNIDEKDASYCELGVIVSDQTNADINNSTVFKQKGVYDPAVTARLSGLQSDTHYYCRLYVKYPGAGGQSEYVYGDPVIIRTKNFDEVAVDLGLPSGNLWASYNVGAEKAEDYGKYYAWTEIKDKSRYTWDTYVNQANTKYNTDTLSSLVSSLKYLELADDAANYNWGGKWRTARNEDMRELRDNCTITHNVEQNGIRGITFRSRNNDNYIFIPYAGFMRDNVLNGVGDAAILFMSDLYFCQSKFGWYFWEYWKQENHFNFLPWDGVPVRPVYPRD